MKKEDIMGMDKSQLTDKETLYKIYEVPGEFERQEMLNALGERAKEFKCYREIQTLIKAFKSELKRAEQEMQTHRMTEFGCPYVDEMNCGSWVANNNGVITLTVFGAMTACPHPILPVARFRNLETGTEKIRLAYKRDNVWTDITTDKDVIASTTKIVSLSKYGVSVTSESAKWLVRFLADIESMNEIPLNSSTSKLGWHGYSADQMGVFLPYDRSITFDSSIRFKDVTDAIREHGSYDMWLNTIKDIRANKEHYEPQLVMSTAFASVLLKPLSLSPFVFNLSGGTGNGKTVALMVATSIYANPGDHKYLMEVEATQVGFEVRLDILNHLPLMIDDFSKIEDKFKDRFTDLIYMLTAGKGKDRATIDLGLNAAKTWCNITIGAMERPLVNDTMRGGAINRVLDFASPHRQIFKNPNRLVETIKENYGFAGKMFVDIVQEIGMERIKEKRAEFERAIMKEAEIQESQKEGKQVLPLSAILTADWIATEYIFKDGIYLDVDKLVAELADIQEVSEYQRGYDYVINYVDSHPNEFIPNEETGEYKGRMGGFLEDNLIYINPNVFRDIAEHGNFSVQAFCREAKERGVLKSNNKLQKVVHRNGVYQRFYCIVRSGESDEIDGEWSEMGENFENPFE